MLQPTSAIEPSCPRLEQNSANAVYDGMSKGCTRPPTYRLSCLLCGRALEVERLPSKRRCPICGGYQEARWTHEWEISI